MKNIVLILFLIVLTSCATNSRKYTGIDREFTSYISYIDNLFGANGIPDISDSGIEIILGDTEAISSKYDKTIAGVCVGSKRRDNKLIIIDSAVWDRFDDKHRVWLLLHEIGHCAFDFRHTKRRDNIMYPKIPKDIRDFKMSLRIFIHKAKVYTRKKSY